MMDNTTILLLSISVTIVLGLVGVVYRSLSADLSKKVDKELYIQTISSIQKAVDGINGAAMILKGVVESIANIHEKFLTIKEHEYICKLKEKSK